jgi:5-methylthioribose kinase
VPSPILELDSDENARAWVLARLGRRPDRVVPLSGGVSNTVLLVQTGAERLIVKQSLPQLRVEAEWFCDRKRILRECAALKLLGSSLPPGSLPSVISEDADNCSFVMTAAPEGAETWKAELLRGETRPAIAAQLGETLAAVIASTRGNKSAEHQFGDISIFDQLRLDAYYRYTAARHPDLAPFFQDLIDDCAERRYSLVHGDWSPKNVLVTAQSAMAIDWECVHYGNPAFDAAFLLNHLVLKSYHLPAQANEFARLAHSFWTALRSNLPDAEFLEASTVRHWAGLLLARMDGKSPVEYITEPHLKDRIRLLARDLIERTPRTVGEVFDRRLRCL